MRALSLDLVSKITDAYDEPGSTIRSVATRFRVSKNIVQKYVTLKQEGLLRTELSHKRESVLTAHMSLLINMLGEQPDSTLAQYCEILEAKTGLKVSIATMSRTVNELKSSKNKCKKSKLLGAA